MKFSNLKCELLKIPLKLNEESLLEIKGSLQEGGREGYLQGGVCASPGRNYPWIQLQKFGTNCKSQAPEFIFWNFEILSPWQPHTTRTMHNQNMYVSMVHVCVHKIPFMFPFRGSNIRSDWFLTKPAWFLTFLEVISIFLPLPWSLECQTFFLLSQVPQGIITHKVPTQSDSILTDSSAFEALVPLIDALRRNWPHATLHCPQRSFVIIFVMTSKWPSTILKMDPCRAEDLTSWNLITKFPVETRNHGGKWG